MEGDRKPPGSDGAWGGGGHLRWMERGGDGGVCQGSIKLPSLFLKGQKTSRMMFVVLASFKGHDLMISSETLVRRE